MKRLRSALAAAAALLASSALADPIFTAATSPGGVAFWWRLRTDGPKATLIAGWPDGLSMTSPGKEGLTPLAQNVIVRGAGGRSANEITEAMQDLGASGGVFGDEWTTIASLQATPDKIYDAALIEGSMLTSPAIEQKELDRARKALSDRMKQAQTTGEAIASLALGRLLYGDQPITRRVDPARMDTITREDIDAWRKAVFTRQNMVVAVSGDMSVAGFGALVDKMVGGLPEKSDLPKAERPDPHYQAKTIVIEKEQAQTILVVVADTKVKQDREQLRSSIGVEVLGGGPESRIFSNLRKKLGASYGAYARFIGMPAHRLVTMGGPVDNAKAPEALAAIVQEYEHWRSQGVTQEEFDATRRRVQTQLDTGYARPGSDVGEFVGTVLSGRPPNDSADYAARLASYTRENVNADIAARFMPGPLLTIIVAPSAAPFKADCVVKDWREVAGCK